jgi:hypothetical protein
VVRSGDIRVVRRARTRRSLAGQERYHGDTETRRVLLEQDLTERIIGAAIEVHRALGPGLLESTYGQCLCHELGFLGLKFERQLELPLFYKDIEVSCG